VNQKKDIKRQKDRLEALKKEVEEERTRARQAARERVLRDFERGQLNLAGNSTESGSTTSNASNVEGCESGYFPSIIVKTFNPARGTKRKTPPPHDDSSLSPSSATFSFSAKAVEEINQNAEEAAMKQIEIEQAAALKHKLPDFWLPSLTPTHSASAPQSLAEIDVGVKKLQTVCRGSAEGHPITYGFINASHETRLNGFVVQC